MYGTYLTGEEVETLREAKIANPHWFGAVIYCASLMVPRRKKYSGNKHSYFNFFDMAKRIGISLTQVFLFYANIKLSRLGVGSIENMTVVDRQETSLTVKVNFLDEGTQGDFGDDPKQDSWADAANYSLLALGSIMHRLNADDVETYVEPDHNESLYKWPVVCLDFDGVFNHQQNWNGTYRHYPPLHGILDFLQALKSKGYTIVVHTARPDISETWNWLDDNGLMDYIESVTNIKPAAVAYIDDRAIPFNGDFKDVFQQLGKFKPYWEVEVDKETV